MRTVGSLSEAMNLKIRDLKASLPEIAEASPSALYSGQIVDYAVMLKDGQSEFRWGISIWGIDTITGVSLPEEEADA